MSLFKSREWWTTVVGQDEEFDAGCLCVANIDNQANDGDKIIVGSFHGYVRIYRPRPLKVEGVWSGFRPDDVLCEMHLPNPVLQVEAGRFISGSDSLHLAILQPRKISIYTCAGNRGHVEHGTQYALKLAYEHNLKRSAANFCYGPFGGVKDKDFVCVQSMDGTVSVFEQESFAFCRFLPGALLPGPICYVQRTDSFVTVSSCRQVESYKYQILAVATDVKTKEESQNIKSGKKVVHDWVLNIGEEALDMRVVTFDNTPCTIMVLGTRNFFIISDIGKIRHMKKFDFNPSCFLPYASLREGTISTIIGTHTKTILVHEDITVKWAAILPRVPVQVCTGNFNDLKGVIVTIDDEGHLQCSYLGTDPAMFSPPTMEIREIDYAQQDAEMRQLQSIIKQHKSKQIVPKPSARTDNEVQLIVSVNPDLDPVSRAVDTEIEDEDPVPSISVKIQLTAKVPVTDIRMTVHAPTPLAATEQLLVFNSIDVGHPAEVAVTFFLQRNFLPSATKADVTISYILPGGLPRVVEGVVPLPLKLIIKPCMPVKNATYKVTLDTNKAPVNLNDLFPDLLGENAGGPGNALGFQLYGGPVITVLASKTSQRYRLQCDVFEAMWLLLSEITSRLTAYHRQRKVNGFKVTYEGALPLQEYFEVLDRHFECRLNDENYRLLLVDRASQFRAIQRRLLTRFKDKTPAALCNLDTLLDGTYRQLLALADATDENLRNQQRCALALSAATRTLNLLIRLWSDMSDDEFSILQSALTTSVTENGEQGWEEIVDAAITHLLRTSLAKNTKDTTLNPAPLALLKDTTKLKKHIALLCDRLGKGATLGNTQGPVTMPTSDSQSKRKPLKTGALAPGLIIDDSDEPVTVGELDEAQVPVGSTFGENKSPRTPRTVSSKNLPPLTEHRPSSTQLAPLGEGRNFRSKDSVLSVSGIRVPDLDNLGDESGDPSGSDS